MAVNISNREYGFDGTSVPCDATFVFDYSDLFKGKNIYGITKNWTIKASDSSLDDSSALLKISR
ncbi:MAG TPA: hypothetical protein VIO64_21650 [Pseudobacteroides sp.]|uniref:hypothetical protein n=1 Tax=Pseudobacteroides sp. TaxID=1968840 RepID=UPI002F931D3C